MDKTWSMRQVRASDAERVGAHGHFREASGSERQILCANWVRSRIESSRYVGWFAMDGDCVVGGAGAILLDWGPTRANPGGVMARINNVFTEPAWRRRGVARTLLLAVFEQCEAMGIREFNLGATPEARSLYGTLGFESYPAEMRRRVTAD
jgi:GNAT superfamily N-acetyltransferase